LLGWMLLFSIEFSYLGMHIFTSAHCAPIPDYC
jgi:hypothetical protein